MDIELLSDVPSEIFISCDIPFFKYDKTQPFSPLGPIDMFQQSFDIKEPPHEFVDMNEVSGVFKDANEWTCRYQRNNKRSGLKNMRCFPMCSEGEHRLKGFCGRSSTVVVTNPSKKPLVCYATFAREGDVSEEEVHLELGTTLKESEVTAKVRTKHNPFLPWLEGESAQVGKDGILSNPDFRTQETVDFVFNKNKKGWHYGWFASKHTCDSVHVLRVYVFEKLSDNRLLLIHQMDSPGFTLFCRRRQRQNLDTLPPQLKKQLEISQAEKALLPQTALGKRKTSSSLIVEDLPEGSVIPEATVSQKETLLFHVMRALLRLDTKAQKPSVTKVPSSNTGGAPAPAVTYENDQVFHTYHGDFPDFFNIDFSVLEGEVRKSSKQSSIHFVPKKELKFGQIIQELGLFIIEESVFTDKLESAMVELTIAGSKDPEMSRLRAGSVLLDLLDTFLSRFQITSSELYYLFKSQVWNKKLKRLNQSNKSVADLEAVSDILAEQESAKTFAETLAYYQDTVLNARPFSGITASICHMENTIAVDPTNDFNGLYERDNETLDILENIRESMGVPWVLRKCLRYVEKNLSMRHIDGCIEVRSNRKLLSNGYAKYILDGKPHTWVSPSPVPTEGHQGQVNTYEATLENGVLCITHNYSKKKRVKRETRKFDGVISSTVTFQYRDNLKQAWQDRLVTTCSAYRVNTSSPIADDGLPTKPANDIDEEIFWLANPMSDFAMEF